MNTFLHCLLLSELKSLRRDSRLTSLQMLFTIDHATVVIRTPSSFIPNKREPVYCGISERGTRRHGRPEKHERTCEFTLKVSPECAR
jgi:hypothetical protein